MIISARPLYLIAGLAATLLLNACATTTTTMLYPLNPTPTRIQKKVHAGDKVVITTKTDKEYKLEVTQVTSEAVVGKSAFEEKEVTVPFEQINTIKVERITRVYKDQSPEARGGRTVGGDCADVSSLTRGARGGNMSRGSSDALDRLPELRVLLAEALFDAESVMADPSVHSGKERERLFEQVRANLEQAFSIAGGSEDELTGLMVQISQVVAREFKARK